MQIIAALLIALSILILFYTFRQLKRIDLVFEIRIKWIRKNNNLYNKYSFEQMLKPIKSNWYGFKLPKENDFK